MALLYFREGPTQRNENKARFIPRIRKNWKSLRDAEEAARLISR